MMLRHGLLVASLWLVAACSTGGHNRHQGTQNSTSSNDDDTVELAGHWESVGGTIAGCSSQRFDLTEGEVTADVVVLSSKSAKVTVKANGISCMVLASVLPGSSNSTLTADGTTTCDAGAGSTPLQGWLTSGDGVVGQLVMSKGCEGGAGGFSIMAAMENL